MSRCFSDAKEIDCDSSSVLTEQDCPSEEPEAHMGDHDFDTPPGGSTEGTIEGSTTAGLDAGASEGASDGNGNGGSALYDAGAMDGSGNADGTSDGNTDGAQTTDAGGLDGFGDGQTEGAALLDAGQQDGASDGATDGQSDGASDNIVNIDCGVDAGLPEDLGREIIVLAQKQEALDTLDAGVTNNVATLIDGPTDVVVYGDYVYWTNFGGDTVMRILKTGGAPEIVASGQSTPDGLAIDETGVYWTNYEKFYGRQCQPIGARECHR